MEPRQTPTYEANVPEDLSGDGEMACELATAYFGDPLPWQPHLLDAMLARDARDKYLLRTLGISIPRQNGKSWVVRARCFYGALNGEKILYTCQHGDTSDQMFKELSQPFEDEDETELHDLLLAVRKTNGQQAISLKNGGLIRFTTRTNSLARGKTYDVLIYDEAQSMRSLIDDVLTLSRLDETSLSADAATPIDLLKTAERVSGRLDGFASERTVRVNVEGEHACILGAETLVEEMLYNLIENGIRYNREGGTVNVSVRMELPTSAEQDADARMFPALEKSRMRAVVRVSDTGPGIPEGKRDKIFERFYRLDKSRSKETGGTGLGLAIVKHAVLYHHGSIEVEGEEGKGTTFVLRFPMA